MKDFTTSTQTVAGYAVKGIHFNKMVNAYIGRIYDPTWSSSGEPQWLTATWNKRGQCRNQTRQDCNLA